MQLLSSFHGSIQAYSPYDPQIEEQIPSSCPVCGHPRLEGKGTYSRQVWRPEVHEIKVRQVRCQHPDCKVTISLLPSFCVPFKRYSAEIIESCLGAVLREGESIRHWCARTFRTDRCTAGSWVGQFRAGAGLLSTEGCSRLGVRPPGGFGGQAGMLWATLRAWAGSRAVLHVVQPAMCQRAPFLGLFRAPL